MGIFSDSNNFVFLIQEVLESDEYFEKKWHQSILFESEMWIIHHNQINSDAENIAWLWPTLQHFYEIA